MNGMQEKYGTKGLKILAINVDKERDLADSFLREVPASFSVHYDPQGELATAFHLPREPFLIQRIFFLSPTVSS